MNKHVIYGLIDPNTNQLRYVGYTSNFERRINDHHTNLFGKSHKISWIKSLLAKGQQADAYIIEEYQTAEELPQAEIEMIAYCKYIGCRLTNSTNGGDGIFGYKHSEETKKILSEKQKANSYNKGKHLSNEYKQKISASLSGRGANKGEANPRAKLTQAIVDAIRSEYIPGRGGNRQILAVKYNTPASTISKIIAYETWK